MRRAEFSYWLQESVYHRVQEDISSLDESSDLVHIFLLLTGRQLDAAVELAASRGDGRLSCLLSQAGGSPVTRSDIAHQLDIWRKNGMDFNFFEENRLRLLELLAGNIHGALHGVKIDWRRFLGLLMWYQFPPDVSLPAVFNTYQKLVNDGNAPYPVPVYLDEGRIDEAGNWETVLEAIGTFSSNDLHVLDMGFVSQLLCVGQCHRAVYVVLHMTHREDYPYLQTTVIRDSFTVLRSLEYTGFTMELH